jgi:hypothetical protein
MTIMLRAAVLAVSIASIGTAYAGDGGGTIANTQFTEIPGVVAEAQVQNNQAIAAAQGRPGVATFVTQRRTTSAFPWNANEGVGG